MEERYEKRNRFQMIRIALLLPFFIVLTAWAVRTYGWPITLLEIARMTIGAVAMVWIFRRVGLLPKR